MSKLSNGLSTVFEACRKVIAPTREEKAEQRKQDEIRDLTFKLAHAVRGVKVENPGQEEIYAASIMMAGLPVVPQVPKKITALTDIQKDWHIKDVSAKLSALGVPEDQIADIIEHSEEALRNPKPDQYFGF